MTKAHAESCPSNACGHCGHTRDQHCGCGVECDQPASLADVGKANFEPCPCPGFESKAALAQRRAVEATAEPTTRGKGTKRAKPLASANGNGTAPPATS